MHHILKWIQREVKHLNQLGVLLLTCLIGSYLLICWLKVKLSTTNNCWWKNPKNSYIKPYQCQLLLMQFYIIYTLFQKFIDIAMLTKPGRIFMPWLHKKNYKPYRHSVHKKSSLFGFLLIINLPKNCFRLYTATNFVWGRLWQNSWFVLVFKNQGEHAI